MNLIKIIILCGMVIYAIFLGICMIYAVFYNLWGGKDKWKK